MRVNSVMLTGAGVEVKNAINVQKSVQKASKISLGTPLEPSWRLPRRHGGVQDPFKSEELVFALTLERNGHSGEKW